MKKVWFGILVVGALLATENNALGEVNNGSNTVMGQDNLEGGCSPVGAVNGNCTCVGVGGPSHGGIVWDYSYDDGHPHWQTYEGLGGGYLETYWYCPGSGGGSAGGSGGGGSSSTSCSASVGEHECTSLPGAGCRFCQAGNKWFCHRCGNEEVGSSTSPCGTPAANGWEYYPNGCPAGLEELAVCSSSTSYRICGCPCVNDSNYKTDNSQCPDGQVLDDEQVCSCNSRYKKCKCDCAAYGYELNKTCSNNEYTRTCPCNSNYKKCVTKPCAGKVKCSPVDGKNPIGCKKETPCFTDGDIYCSGLGKCTYPADQCSMGDTPRVIIDILDDDVQGIDCQTSDEGMRNCDALGYLQTASECANATQKLKCPFDDNRYFCGGKISSEKKCSSIFNANGVVSTLAVAAFTGNTQTGLNDCNRIDDIVLHNMCIRRFCDSCHIRRSQNEYCVSASSYPIYKLTCDSDAICLGDEDENDVDVEGPDDVGSQNSENESLGEESDQGEMRCNAGELLVDGKCIKCMGKSCDHKK